MAIVLALVHTLGTLVNICVCVGVGGCVWGWVGVCMCEGCVCACVLDQQQFLTITQPSIRIKSISSVTATGIRADVVMAILSTSVGTFCTLVNI